MSPDLRVLIDLFYTAPDQLGRFQEVVAGDLPDYARQLLAHDEHMTVAIESFHACRVDVEVLATNTTANHYARKILLRRTTDKTVVQFGLVRLNVSLLGEAVRREIESESAPLGRILIEHNVLRKVRLLSLWRIDPGEDLKKMFGLSQRATCYGRTALIYCNSVPAVELLEIVTPS